MLRYIAQRLLAGLLTAFIVSLLIFVLLRIVSGHSISHVHSHFLGGICTDSIPQYCSWYKLSAPPLHIQYLNWVGGWVTGEWNESLRTEYIAWTGEWPWGPPEWEWRQPVRARPVWEHFAKRLPVTLQLVAMSQAIAVLIGVSAGILMAVKSDSRVDHLGRAIAKSGLSIHIVWSTTLLLVGGFLLFDWSPSIGHAPLLEDPIGSLDQFLFPAIALGYSGCAVVALTTRYYVLDILFRQDYVRPIPSRSQVTPRLCSYTH